jgi:hypothetical protein
VRKRIGQGEHFDDELRHLFATHDDEKLLHKIGKHWRKPLLEFMMGLTYGKRPSWNELVALDQGNLNQRGVYGLFFQW